MTTLLNTDCICIINLPDRADRLSNILDNIKFNKENIVIFPGVYYQIEEENGTITQIEKDITTDINTNTKYLEKNPGHRGCFIAFYRLFKWLLTQDFERILICEDDTIFHKYFCDLYNKFISPKILEEDIGMIYLHQHFQTNWDIYNVVDKFTFDKNYNIFLNKLDKDSNIALTSIVIKKGDIKELIKFMENHEIRDNLKYHLAIDDLIPSTYIYFSKDITNMSRNPYILSDPLVFDKSIIQFDSSTIVNDLKYHDYQGIFDNVSNLLNLLDNIDKNKNEIISTKNDLLKKYFKKNQISFTVKVHNNELQHFFVRFFIRYLGKNLKLVNSSDSADLDLKYDSNQLVINNTQFIKFPKILLQSFNGLYLVDFLQNPDIKLNNFIPNITLSNQEIINQYRILEKTLKNILEEKKH